LNTLDPHIRTFALLGRQSVSTDIVVRARGGQGGSTLTMNEFLLGLQKAY
jgi:hypothetical protein